MRHPMIKVKHALFLFLTLLTQDIYADWGPPTLVIPFTSTTSTPAVGIDASGNAIAIGVGTDDNTNYLVKTVQIINGQLVNPTSFSATSPNSPNISVNAGGNAGIAWIDLDLGNSHSITNGAVFIGGNWSVPETISDAVNNYSSADLPGINMDQTNQSLVFWDGFTSSLNDLWYNKYASGWLGSPVEIYNTTNGLRPFAFSGAPNGKALMTWTEFTSFTLNAGYYDGSSWTLTQNLSSDVSTRCGVIAPTSMNALNNAVIIWPTASQGINAMLYTNGSFGSPEVIYTPTAPDTADGISNLIAVALNNSGIATAAWTVTNNDDFSTKLMVSRRTNQGWSSPVVIDTSLDPENIQYVNVGMDDQGNAIVVWEHDDSDENGGIFYDYFNASTNSWLPVRLPIPTTGEPSFYPYLSVNGNGDAIVVWATDTAVYASEFSPSNTLFPPRHLKGKQIVNRFLISTQIINKLIWGESLDPNVTSYYVYKNGKKVSTIPSSRYFVIVNKIGIPSKRYLYIDQLSKRKKKIVYQVTAVTSDGVQSEPVTWTSP